MSRRRITEITEATAALIKGMVARGDRQMDVAIYHGINQGRVNEIVHGRRGGARFRHVPPSPLDQLPEPGPYTIVARVTHDRNVVASAIVAELELLLKRYRETAHITSP